MDEAENKIKQQIVDKIKTSTNILVTVSKNPSVDELSAGLGLTVLLNKLDKHTTAIFSGAFPPAITFLDPDKVFEATADSLRDFIIALDKEKADHLRYKVDGDVVKIFITPYRTTITDQDLEFSQGDFNVELVLALGVNDQEHLDTALASSGQMLHNVTIATFSAGDQSSHLGSMDWRDIDASSLSEMVVSISDSLKTDKSILDKQIATALLTGIVSATERFSNSRTSSRVMSMAAQLMAAGADQQLIAAKLQEPHAIDSLPSAAMDNVIAPEPVVNAVAEQPVVVPTELPSDIFSIPHNEDVEGVAAVDQFVEPVPVEAVPSSQPDYIELPPSPPLPSPLPPPLPLTPPVPIAQPPLPPVSPAPVYAENRIIPDLPRPKFEEAREPVFGGVLNATSDQAADDARRELDDQQNKTILSHSYLVGSDSNQVGPINGANQPEDGKMVDIFAEDTREASAPQPSIGLPLPPPLPDYSTLPPASAFPDINATYAPSNSNSAPAAATNDPSQFKIPV